MVDLVEKEIMEAHGRYINELLHWPEDSGLDQDAFNQVERQAIEQACYLYVNMIIEQGFNRFYLFRNIYLYRGPVKDGYGMCQPLIDGSGGITGYRIYISNEYRFSSKQLQEVFLHEMLHTMSRYNILQHKSMLFYACYRYLERYYDINVFNIGYAEKWEDMDD